MSSHIHTAEPCKSHKIDIGGIQDQFYTHQNGYSIATSDYTIQSKTKK
jgi:hypothetical protein